MDKEKEVANLILGLLGLPSIDEIKKLSKKAKDKIKVELVRKDKEPVNIVRVLKELKNIVDVEERVEGSNKIKALYPATIIHGLYKGRMIIYGDMPSLLSHVFGEMIALAHGLLGSEVPETIADELKRNLSSKPIDVQIFVVPGIPCVKACHMFSHIGLLLNDINIEIIDVDTHEKYFEEYSDGPLPLIIINEKTRKVGSPRSYREIKELLEKAI